MKLRDLFVYNTKQLVIVEEEFGFNHWLWLPDFPLENLPEFWQNITHFDIKKPSKVLSGQLVNIDYPRKPRAEKFITSLEKQPHYFAHVFCDHYSYLRTPDGKIIQHAGYKTQQECCNPHGIIDSIDNPL